MRGTTLIYHAKFADSLHLSTQRRPYVTIASFRATETSKQTLPVATIHLETTDGTEIAISVLITPRITQPLHNFSFSYMKQLLYLKGLATTKSMQSQTAMTLTFPCSLKPMPIGSLYIEAVVCGSGPLSSSIQTWIFTIV